MKKARTICYLGIYSDVFSRNKIYIKGLRKHGVKVIECRDDSKGLLKYWRLWRKHAAIQDSYDALIIGYLEHILVPFAKLISSRPIIADMLGSLADAERLSHNPGTWRLLKNLLIDRLAVTFADIVLLESEAQKAYFIQQFGDREKFKVLYTGVDESVLYCSPGSTQSRNTVLFRGRLTPESGIFHILEAARFLKSRSDITFRIIGTHYRLAQPVKTMISEANLTNVEFINEHLSDEALRDKMCGTAVALGQFESSPRLDRTIPHKAFEAMYMGLPFITAYSPAVGELLTDGESCLFVKRADPADLAKKITTIIDDSGLGQKLVRSARSVYDRKCSNDILITRLLAIISEQI
jgi:glycosyltransferase involved in cell wall biosynthesis